MKCEEFKKKLISSETLNEEDRKHLGCCLSCRKEYDDLFEKKLEKAALFLKKNTDKTLSVNFNKKVMQNIKPEPVKNIFSIFNFKLLKFSIQAAVAVFVVVFSIQFFLVENQDLASENDLNINNQNNYRILILTGQPEVFLNSKSVKTDENFRSEKFTVVTDKLTSIEILDTQNNIIKVAPDSKLTFDKRSIFHYSGFAEYKINPGNGVFNVTAGDFINIAVLGTEFSVNNKENAGEVFLREGIISVKSGEWNEILSSGQKVEWDREKGLITKHEAGNFIDYKGFDPFGEEYFINNPEDYLTSEEMLELIKNAD